MWFRERFPILNYIWSLAFIEPHSHRYIYKLFITSLNSKVQLQFRICNFDFQNLNQFWIVQSIVWLIEFLRVIRVFLFYKRWNVHGLFSEINCSQNVTINQSIDFNVQRQLYVSNSKFVIIIVHRILIATLFVFSKMKVEHDSCLFWSK